MAPSELQLLLVEDNPRLLASLARGFDEEGFATLHAATGAAAIEIAARGQHDAIVLDLGLPDLDGLDVLRAVRCEASRCPVIVLTARDAVASRVAALDAGADDYLIKPFAFEELLARVRALIRRASGPRWAPIVAGGIQLADDRSVTLDGRVVPLSPREHGLLAYLLRRRGEVVPRKDLLREVFGYAFDPGTNVIDVHLGHLRRKLAGGPIAIETVRGAGFRLTLG